MSFPVILASNSPARLMLLKTQKINPIVIPSEINEKDLENSFKDSPVSKIVLELSIAKAKNVLENNISLTEGILIAADSIHFPAVDSLDKLTSIDLSNLCFLVQ